MECLTFMGLSDSPRSSWGILTHVQEVSPLSPSLPPPQIHQMSQHSQNPPCTPRGALVHTVPESGFPFPHPFCLENSFTSLMIQIKCLPDPTHITHTLIFSPIQARLPCTFVQVVHCTTLEAPFAKITVVLSRCSFI